MDVHPPHEPIHSWRDFLLHLATITIGLLIAVGIEGCVELRHEHRLVRDARATLREEIQHNVGVMATATDNLSKQKVILARNVDALTRIMEHPEDKTAQNAAIVANYSSQSLHETAWKTAQATNALAYMPYSEAQKYAEIYEAQDTFLAAQDKQIEDEAQLLGVIAKTDFGHGIITPAQASMALERFGVWRGHLVYLDLMAKLTYLSDKAFLDGKDAPKDLYENIQTR